MTPIPRYFDDFYPGQELMLGTCSASEAEIIDFATRFDPQPFHIDPALAAASMFGGVIASGWHTCSMMMRVVVDALFGGSASLGSPGVDKIRWLLPVRPGDVLAVSYRTIQVKASASRPDRGVVWSVWEARNQHGQTVCTLEGMGMFKRRPGQADAQL